MSDRMHDPKPGRNDPCPCGSGKKWKRCHGDDVAEHNADIKRREAERRARAVAEGRRIEFVNGSSAESGVAALDKAMEGGIPPEAIAHVRGRRTLGSSAFGLIAAAAALASFGPGPGDARRHVDPWKRR